MNTPKTLSFSERYEKHLFEKGIENDQLLKVLNITLDYLGAKSIKDYANQNNTTVQNVYQNKDIQSILGKKVVFDNH